MVRGAGRGGRGMPGRGGMGRPPFNRPRMLMLRPPFDLILAEPAFPRCKPAPDDSALTQALLKRHAELCPTPAEQSAVLSLVTKLQTVLDNLVVAPGDFAACQLEEVRQVGSYKKGTMMAGKNVADIVVIMKTLPTKEAVEGLSNKVHEELNKLMRAETPPTCVTSHCHERGFTVTAPTAAVRVLVTTLHQNLRKLEPEVHLEYKMISSHLAAIRHSRWFEENAHHSSIKVLIRLLRDMCSRHSGLEPLTPWMIDLLAHHCIMNNPARQALPINVAFRRALSLLAGGLFLPGCAGLADPCEAAHARAHTALDLAAQDLAAATAQTLLRVVARGGHRYVLGLQAFEGGKDISTEITVWDGVVVSPLAPAYQEIPEPMDTDDKVYGKNKLKPAHIVKVSRKAGIAPPKTGPGKTGTASPKAGPVKTGIAPSKAGPVKTETAPLEAVPAIAGSAPSKAGPVKTGTATSKAGPVKTGTAPPKAVPAIAGTAPSKAGPVKTGTAPPKVVPAIAGTAPSKAGPVKTGTAPSKAGPVKTGTAPTKAVPAIAGIAPPKAVPAIAGTAPSKAGPVKTGTAPPKVVPAIAGTAPSKAGPVKTGTAPSKAGPVKTGTAPTKAVPAIAGIAPPKAVPAIAGTAPPQVVPAIDGTAPSEAGSVKTGTATCKAGPAKAGTAFPIVGPPRDGPAAGLSRDGTEVGLSKDGPNDGLPMDGTVAGSSRDDLATVPSAVKPPKDETATGSTRDGTASRQSGAQRRKRRKLRQQAALNGTPTSESPIQKSCADLTGDGEDTAAKMVKATQSSLIASLRDAVAVKLAIVTVKYPDEYLTAKDLMAIQELIIEKLEEAPDPLPILTVASRVVAGSVLVTCSKSDDACWLRDAIHNVELGLVKLKVIDARDLAKPIKMAWKCKFTLKVARALRLLQGFNPKLRTDEWKVINTLIEKTGIRHIVLMDRVSAGVIKDSGFCLPGEIEQYTFKLLEEDREVPVVEQETPPQDGQSQDCEAMREDPAQDKKLELDVGTRPSGVDGDIIGDLDALDDELQDGVAA